MKKHILRSVLALCILALSGSLWASGGSEGTSITVYTIGCYFSKNDVVWDYTNSTINIDVRRDGNSWSDYGYHPIWNAEMTPTGKTYMGFPIYSYTFNEYYEGAEIRFKHYVSGVAKEDYDTEWTGMTTMNGKLYLGFYGAHNWVDYDDNIRPIYLDMNQASDDWTSSSAVFKMNDGDNTVWGVKVKDKLYAFSSCKTDISNLKFYRCNPDGLGTWNSDESVEYSSDYNTYKVVSWNDIQCANDNINLVNKTTRVYFDNSYLGISETYKYLIIGHDNFSGYSKCYDATASIGNTNLLYYEISSDVWRDATYYGFVGIGTSWSNGSWGSSNLANGTKRTAAYKSQYDLGSGHVSLFYTSAEGNDQTLDVTYKGTNSSSLNTTQTIQYVLSTDGGASYSPMSSGNTPGQISISAYKFVDDTYNSVSNSENTATISSNTSGTYSTTVDAAYTGTTTLSASARDGYTFVDWNGASTTCHPKAETTYTARFKAHRYDILFDANDGQYPGTASGEMTKISNVVYDQNQTLTSNAFSRTGYTFSGWATSASGSKVYNDGASVSNLSSDDDADVTLYAVWTVNPYRVDVASVDHVTISATTPSIEEGGNANANYGSTVSLSYASVESGYAFGYWKVYKTDDESTTVTVTNNQFTMPAYAVTVSAVMATDLKVWCAPEDFVFSAPNGGDHLTSTKDVYVHSTSKAGNLLNIQCSDFGSATEMEIAYLDADEADDEVDKDESLFRLYDAAASAAIDAYSSTKDIRASRVLNTDFSIRYTPNAYGTTNHYKLRLTLKKGEYTLKIVTKDLYGRSLPEEFVIAVKNGDYWYALPNNLAGTQAEQGPISPILIQVDDNTTPTKAVSAPTTTCYQAANRYTATNLNGFRFTNDGRHWLQVSTSSGVADMWLSSTGGTDVQDWYLKSSDFGAYEIARDPIGRGEDTRRIELYSGVGGQKLGFHGALTGTGNVYLLPIESKYTPIEATVYEWGEHGVIVAPDRSSLGSLASATMNISGNDPADAVISSVHGASLTAGKYIRVYDEDATIGDISNEGKILYIHWKDGEGDDIGTSEMTIPRIIASSRDMKTDGEPFKNKWTNKEVHILPGVTLTANTAGYSPSGATIGELHVYPGATLKVQDGTLTANTLRLRNGWTRAGDKSYDVARVYIADDAALAKTYASMDYDIYDASEGNHYYPIAVPFATAVDTIDYIDETLAGASIYGSHYVIKEYNGYNRAINGTGDANWKVVASDATLQPGIGYIMTGVGIPAYGGCIIRIPLKFDNGWTSDGEKATIDDSYFKNTVAVTAYTGAAATSNKSHAGWNMLGVPYMSCYGMNSGDGTASILPGKMVVSDGEITWDADGLTYVSVPTHDFSEYIQKEITDDEAVDPKDAQLLPGWSFFVQIGTSGNLTFLTNKQRTDSDLPIYAPKREANNSPVVKTGIVLSDGTKSDKTTFLISDKYSSEYEIGADLEKMFGNAFTLSTYSITNGTKLAFNALSTAEAQQAIPVGVRIPADGQYTFSLNSRYAEANIERLDLIDYEAGEVTNLLQADYTFTATSGQNDSRFALNVKKAPAVVTDIENTESRTQNTDIRKVIINDKMFIIRDGKMYDATGKKVKGNR